MFLVVISSCVIIRLFPVCLIFDLFLCFLGVMALF